MIRTRRQRTYHPRRHLPARATSASVIVMEAPTANDTLSALHRAIAQAAAGGTSYQWIAGALAACLATETTTEHARHLALDTLEQAVTPSRRPAA